MRIGADRKDREAVPSIEPGAARIRVAQYRRPPKRIQERSRGTAPSTPALIFTGIRRRLPVNRSAGFHLFLSAPMAVITIARQLGAGGGAVATRLAERLGWRLLDRELVEQIADDLEVAPEQVEAHDERVEHFVERLGMYLSEGFPEILPVPVLPPVSPDLAARAARRIVAAVAAEGPAVIVGHGAQCVLAGDPRALHVLVHAPAPFRAARAAERFGVPADQATERVRRSDADRKAYIREHFRREWLDPALYDLCVDTAALGIECAAQMIVAAAERKLGIGSGMAG